MARTKTGNQQVGPRGLSRRDMLVGLGGATAVLPMTQLVAADAPAQPVNTAIEAKLGGDLLDDHYKSESGKHFGSQVIHHGEMNGFNVTPISQDKAPINKVLEDRMTKFFGLC